MTDPLRILMCSVPLPGHVNPGVPVARSLVGRGHEVVWYTGRDHRRVVEASGARFEPIIDAHDPADEPFESRWPDRAGLDD